jgi:hypothetical protein
MAEKEEMVKVTTRIPARFWPKEAAHGARRTRLIELLELGEAAEKAGALKCADLPPREDGLAWGEKRKHRLTDDPLGMKELAMLMALGPRPTFEEAGRLLGGYSRNVISERAREMEEWHGRE